MTTQPKPPATGSSTRSWRAIHASREATGAGPADAERVVLRLQEILRTTRELNAGDKRFLDDFRAGLRPGSLFELLDRPHLSLPRQLAPRRPDGEAAVARVHRQRAALWVLLGLWAVAWIVRRLRSKTA